ncbi:Hypothetical_protein [Hexamita inflata]|nr:Hypothetical protein HINF_LOCUS44977 [Hexamita inflata]
MSHPANNDQIFYGIPLHEVIDCSVSNTGNKPTAYVTDAGRYQLGLIYEKSAGMCSGPAKTIYRPVKFVDRYGNAKDIPLPANYVHVPFKQMYQATGIKKDVKSIDQIIQEKKQEDILSCTK